MTEGSKAETCNAEITMPPAKQIPKEHIELLLRSAALNNDVKPEVAQRITRLLFAAAALSDGPVDARVYFKFHDTSEANGQLRKHGEFGVCVGCIRVETAFGHACASIAPGGGACCLTPHSRILRPLESATAAVHLQIGDAVMAWCESRQSLVETVITKIVKDHPREGYYVINDDLGITPDHPVLVSTPTGVKWRAASDVVIEDFLFHPSAPVRIRSKYYCAEPTPTIYIETAEGSCVACIGDQHCIVSANYAGTFFDDAANYELARI